MKTYQNEACSNITFIHQATSSDIRYDFHTVWSCNDYITSSQDKNAVYRVLLCRRLRSTKANVIWPFAPQTITIHLWDTFNPVRTCTWDQPLVSRSTRTCFGWLKTTVCYSSFTYSLGAETRESGCRIRSIQSGLERLFFSTASRKRN